jgi:hypothetical protein
VYSGADRGGGVVCVSFVVAVIVTNSAGAAGLGAFLRIRQVDVRSWSDPSPSTLTNRLPDTLNVKTRRAMVDARFERLEPMIEKLRSLIGMHMQEMGKAHPAVVDLLQEVEQRLTARFDVVHRGFDRLGLMMNEIVALGPGTPTAPPKTISITRMGRRRHWRGYRVGNRQAESGRLH